MAFSGCDGRHVLVLECNFQEVLFSMNYFDKMGVDFVVVSNISESINLFK